MVVSVALGERVGVHNVVALQCFLLLLSLLFLEYPMSYVCLGVCVPFATLSLEYIYY